MDHGVQKIQIKNIIKNILSLNNSLNVNIYIFTYIFVREKNKPFYEEKEDNGCLAAIISLSFFFVLNLFYKKEACSC